MRQDRQVGEGEQYEEEGKDKVSLRSVGGGGFWGAMWTYLGEGLLERPCGGDGADDVVL